MLEAKDLSVSYGRHRALEKVGVHVERGEICVILGANGAGKSTLLKTLAGLIRPEPGGVVSVDGAAVTGMKPSLIVEKGVALVPESGATFGELTVAENLTLGAYPARARGEEQANLRRVYGLFPVLSKRRRQLARTMSGGEQKMLAIGRALMSNPDILMLDEPSLGLSPLLSTELFRTLKAIGEAGVGILLVEQNARQSLKIADRGYLLENGQIVGEDRAMALASDPAVRRAYLGGEAGPMQPQPIGVAVPPVLRLDGLNAVELGRCADDLAARAAAIHATHVRSAREAKSQPGGMPASGPTRSETRPHTTSELSRMAETLAERAAGMHAAHVRSLREKAKAHAEPAASSGFAQGAPPPAAPPETAPGVTDLTRMAERFARHAAESAAHRNGSGTPANGAPERASSSKQGNGGWPAERAAAPSAIAEALAAHAAAIHARHMAESRAATHSFKTAGEPGEDDTAHVHFKKHKNGKKKHKKWHKRCKHKGD